MVRVRTVQEADAEEKRQKILVIVLFAIGTFGLVYLVHDYIRIMNYTATPEDVAQVDPYIRDLKASGLVRSLDVSSSQLIVDEQSWGEISKAEKTGIITQLARYCAERNNERKWSLNVVTISGINLGGIGSSGLKVN